MPFLSLAILQRVHKKATHTLAHKLNDMSENVHWRSCHKWINSVRWAASGVHQSVDSFGHLEGETSQTSFFFLCHEEIVVENNEFWIMFSVDCLWSNGNLLKSTQQLKALKNGKKIIWLLFNVFRLFADFMCQVDVKLATKIDHFRK